MFTQTVMILTIIFLALTGVNFYIKDRNAPYPGSKIMIIGIFAVAIGILAYAARDIFIQLGQRGPQEAALQLGGVFHLLGSIFIFWFISKKFISRPLGRIFILLGVVIMVTTVFSLNIGPTITKEASQALFEPFSYEIVRPYVEMEEIVYPGVLVFAWQFLAPFLLLGIILFHVLKLEDPAQKRKGIFYGFGLFFLFFPMLICMFVSPIFARWGYLAGAFLLYKAFQMEI